MKTLKYEYAEKMENICSFYTFASAHETCAKFTCFCRCHWAKIYIRNAHWDALRSPFFPCLFVWNNSVCCVCMFYRPPRHIMGNNTPRMCTCACVSAQCYPLRFSYTTRSYTFSDYYNVHRSRTAPSQPPRYCVGCCACRHRSRRRCWYVKIVVMGLCSSIKRVGLRFGSSLICIMLLAILMRTFCLMCVVFRMRARVAVSKMCVRDDD